MALLRHDDRLDGASWYVFILRRVIARLGPVGPYPILTCARRPSRDWILKSSKRRPA